MLKFSWGIGIVIAILLFTSFIGVLVTISMRQKDIYLVSEDYYEQQLKYEEIISGKKNTQLLPGRPLLKVNSLGEILIDFSETQLSDFRNITLTIFRPSDSHHDRSYKFHELTNPILAIPAYPLKAGKWIVKLSWYSEEKFYYWERTLIQ